MEKTIIYIGMDKKDISVAVADGGLRDEARYLGVIPSIDEAVRQEQGASVLLRSRSLRLRRLPPPDGIGP